MPGTPGGSLFVVIIVEGGEDARGDAIGAGGGGIHIGEEVGEGRLDVGIGSDEADIVVDLEQAGEGHAGHGKGAEGFSEDN